MKKLIKKIIVLSMVSMYVTTNSYLVHAEMIAQPYLEGKNTSAEDNTKQENAEVVDSTKQESTEAVDGTKPENAESVDSSKQENTEAVDNTKQEGTETIDGTKPENAESVDSSKQENTEVVDNTKQESTEAVDGTKPENAESVDSSKQENTEVVDSTKQESTEAVDNTKQENNVKSSEAFDINDWEVTESDSEIILNKYIGSSKDIIITGEYNNKQVVLNGLKVFPDNMNSLQIRESNGKKVKIIKKDFFGEKFRDYGKVKEMDLRGLDVSNLNDMSSMFSSCSWLKSLDVSGWDTSNATNMSFMFVNDQQLTTIKGIENWNVSNVRNMMSMFAGSRIKSLDLSSWDTSKVTDMSFMFNQTMELESINASGWDTSNVTNMNFMFGNNCRLEWVDASGWDTSKVTNMDNMFRAGFGEVTQFLIVTKDQKLKNYNYLNDGRIPTGPTFNANGGVFPDGKTTNSPFKTFVLESNSDEGINKILEEAIGKVGVPTKSGTTFIEWEKRSSKVMDDVYDKLSAEYYAKWNTPPVINAEDKVLTVGDSFNPLDGVTAEDPEDGPITIKKEDVVSNVDTKVAGEYTVTYTVTDKHGMTTIKTIKVVVIPKGVVDVEGNGEWGVVIPMSINFTKESKTVDADIKLVGLGNTKLSDFKTLEVDGTVKSENAYKMIGEGNAKDNTASYTYQLNNNNEFAANKSEQPISRLNLTAPKQDGIATLTNGGSKKGKYKDMLTFKFTAVSVVKN
ncbi:BspA family leucine-rich repeat surface protein [Clostridium perfringens]|nr:BspA family leucine-rich repeat surface protein [Clostridium perfringens]